MVFKKQAGINLTKEPKFGQNNLCPFLKCLVRLKSQEEFLRAIESMRFFKIDGK